MSNLKIAEIDLTYYVIIIYYRVLVSIIFQTQNLVQESIFVIFS